MSDILQNIYDHMVFGDTKWCGLNKKQKIDKILSYMKENNIEGNISDYKFKDIVYDFVNKRIIKLKIILIKD